MPDPIEIMKPERHGKQHLDPTPRPARHIMCQLDQRRRVDRREDGMEKVEEGCGVECAGEEDACDSVGGG